MNPESTVSALSKQDPAIAEAIALEHDRQSSMLELIASENFVSDAVLEAAGSILTNKYAEGLPGKRYYGGCENVDVAENLARERQLQLYGADHANVQPHSGSQANAAVCELVAKLLGVPKSAVSVSSGLTSRHKKLSVEGIGLNEAQAKLAI